MKVDVSHLQKLYSKGRQLHSQRQDEAGTLRIGQRHLQPDYNRIVSKQQMFEQSLTTEASRCTLALLT